jgi:hypothetical protein
MEQIITTQKECTVQFTNQWPAHKPALPFDGQGWFQNENLDVFKTVLNTETKLVIELGAWLGLSTRFILQTAPNAKVITIDTWEGSVEHRDMPEVKDKLPILYDQFLANCWDYKDRLIPIRDTSTNALFSLLTQYQLEPDMIYVDASHEEKDVYSDIAQARLFGTAVIVGDDWTWDSVRKAAVRYCNDHYIQQKLHNNGITWWIEQ